jgi:hypothetical protein
MRKGAIHSNAQNGDLLAQYGVERLLSERLSFFTLGFLRTHLRRLLRLD